MMNFKLTPVPAQEGLERPGAVDNNYKDPVSAGAHLQVASEVVMGICDSLARALRAKGYDQTMLSEKMMDLINLFKKNGDMNNELADYLVEHSFGEIEYDVRSEMSKLVEDRGFDAWWIVFRAARSGISCGAQYCEAYRDKMNDREKALVDNLDNARKAYWKATSEYEDYVFDHAIMTINDFVVKYGETLSKIDEQWFGVISTELKSWVERVEKRRAAKMAEGDSTADRATPAA